MKGTAIYTARRSGVTAMPTAVRLGAPRSMIDGHDTLSVIVSITTT
jgi:hypothetical protein